ncbi:MAG: Pr6Pr family membrane protein [Defluviitaleaceae bacterium]|nr:Pr6Pr family membrane protein [Defluviitaleaceae bacterium]
MLKKENIHKLYLLLSAGLILYGVILGLTGGGQIHLFPGMAGSGSVHFRSLKTFTYQSNLLLVIGFIAMLAFGNSRLRQYISVSVILATTVTGLVYNFLLVPFAQAPMFFSGYVNFSTHVLATVLALANYFIFESKGFLHHKHILAGMLFPGAYWAVFVVIGERINFFPYFFMNPNSVGWVMVFVWFAILLIIFAGLGFALMLYDRSNRKKDIVDTIGA